ncbi:polyhydroxyalkanoate synthesis regulator DNA-binding domain-containing protein [Methylobacterium nigriterrae]|uniref:polyhydroxyalkanoate synthesis regulator DNA-binding domain-containing protein n=1 Tax=Methylobacterium nigriterrae TaxID=3127512 RepID=UPI0030138B8D
MQTKKSQPIRQLKRYAGCRLYDPENKAYVSAAELERLKVQGLRIAVRDVETGQDVTDELIPSRVQ